jgi:hypothetical protein
MDIFRTPYRPTEASINFTVKCYLENNGIKIPLQVKLMDTCGNSNLYSSDFFQDMDGINVLYYCVNDMTKKINHWL